MVPPLDDFREGPFEQNLMRPPVTKVVPRHVSVIVGVKQIAKSDPSFNASLAYAEGNSAPVAGIDGCGFSSGRKPCRGLFVPPKLEEKASPA
jgi:hypothetical protein